MPIGKFNTKLRDKKDHFVITLYKNIRRELKINHSNILLFKVNNHKIIRIPNKDFHLTIPKKIIKNKNDEVEIEILEIHDIDKTQLRDKIFFEKDYINTNAFIPKKTIYGKDIYTINQGNYFYMWYSIGGGVKPLKIKKKIELEKLSELLGFYFGDGNTTYNIRSFRLTNCESSVLNYCLDILEEIGINRDQAKIQIIYSSNKEIDNKIRQRCINYWSKELRINKKKIVSVNRSKNKRETLKHGSARIFIDNSNLTELFMHGFLKKFIKIIQNPKSKREEKILKGFLRGLAAAEGWVDLTKKKSLSRVGLAFNPHSKDLELYKRLLNNLNISFGKRHNNGLPITGINNFKILHELELFKIHKKRNDKFLLGYKNHKFSD